MFFANIFISLFILFSCNIYSSMSTILEQHVREKEYEQVGLTIPLLKSIKKQLTSDINLLKDSSFHLAVFRAITMGIYMPFIDTYVIALRNYFDFLECIRVMYEERNIYDDWFKSFINDALQVSEFKKLPDDFEDKRMAFSLLSEEEFFKLTKILHRIRQEGDQVIFSESLFAYVP